MAFKMFILAFMSLLVLETHGICEWSVGEKELSLENIEGYEIKSLDVSHSTWTFINVYTPCKGSMPCDSHDGTFMAIQYHANNPDQCVWTAKWDDGDV